MTKIQYDQEVIRRHICSEEDVEHNWRELAQILDLLGLPALPTNKDSADVLPSTDPPRAKVRFQLTGTFDGGTQIAPAQTVDPNGSALSPGEAFDLFDGVGRYVGAVAGDEYGYAQQFRQADGTLAWEPISLGGLTSAGSGADIHAKVNNADTTSDFLFNKVYNAAGSPPAFGAGYQEVFADVVDAGGGYLTLRWYTSSASATDTFTVLVDSTDSTPNYLWTSMTDATANAFNTATHAKVYFAKVGGSGTNQTMRGYIAYDELDGRTRVHQADALDYLEDQFNDNGAYNASTDVLVFHDNSSPGAGDLRLYVTSTSLTAKIADVNIQLFNNVKKRTDNSVKVKLLKADMTDAGLAEVDCFDRHNEFSSGLSQTAKGRASLVRDGATGTTRLEFTHLEGPALFVCATLDENMQTSPAVEADATVNNYYGPAWHRENPANGSGDVTMVPCSGMHAGLVEGAKVVGALKDPDASPLEYLIIEADGSRTILMAKLTATSTKRISDNYGSATGVSLGVPVAGVWSERLTDQTVLIPALNEVHIPAGETIHMPVGECNGQWMALNCMDLQQVRGFDADEDQAIAHSPGTTTVEWQAIGPCEEVP